MTASHGFQSLPHTKTELSHMKVFLIDNSCTDLWCFDFRVCNPQWQVENATPLEQSFADLSHDMICGSFGSKG